MNADPQPWQAQELEPPFRCCFSRSGLRNAIPTSYFLWILIRLFILINPYQKFNFKIKKTYYCENQILIFYFSVAEFSRQKKYFLSHNPFVYLFPLIFVIYIPRSNQGSLSMFVLWITIRKKILSGFSSLTLISSYQRQVELNCSVVPFEAKLWGETVGRKFRPTVSPLVINVRVLFLSIFSLVYFKTRILRIYTKSRTTLFTIQHQQFQHIPSKKYIVQKNCNNLCIYVYIDGFL